MTRRAAALLLALALALALAAATPGAAEEVVSDINHDEIAITADFTGSDVLVFGAVKREEPIPPGALQVIVTLEGPAGAVTVRHKSRVAGIWINTDSVEIDHAPSYYAVATTAPLPQILAEDEDARHAITIPRAIRSSGPEAAADPAFADALIRIRMAEGAYVLDETGVQLTEDTLFQAEFDMPANLTEGVYKSRIFLLRDGRVIAEQENPIAVRKVGLERWLFALSRQQPLAYGLLSLVLAVFAGWAASALFRYIRS